MSSTVVEQLVYDITEAFQDVTSPSKDKLAEVDGWEYNDICNDFIELINEKISPTDVNDMLLEEVLTKHDDSLPGFTPDGLRYILQYYLTFSLINPNSDVAECVVFHLADMDFSRAYWKTRFPVFSEKQKMIISSFLNTMVTLDDFSRYRITIEDGANKWCQ